MIAALIASPWVAIPLGILKAVWTFLCSLPWQVWGGIAMLAVFLWYGHARYEAGQAEVQARWDAETAAEVAAAARKKAASDVASARVEVRYVERVRVVRERGATIVKEVPVYVPLDSCPLTPGWRVLHDAAAAGRMPDPARLPDAAPVPAQVAAATVADNYATCLENAEAQKGLIEWWQEQAKLRIEVPPKQGE